MATALKDSLLALVGELRAASVRISLAESLDAMSAVAVAGIERTAMREALRASLIKDETDNPAFDAIFERHFAAGVVSGQARRSRGAQIGVSGDGRGDGGGNRAAPPEAKPEELSGSLNRETAAEHDLPADGAARPKPEPMPSDDDTNGAGSGGRGSTENGRDRYRGRIASASDGPDAAGQLAQEIERTPFALYSRFEYERARDALAPIKRRFRALLGRRLRAAARGRIDFRRTLRAATQHGGVLVGLRFRARRPRHVELLVLADISGSVAYASTLMLEIAAGARDLFHRFHCFAYIDRLAEADFERGHLVMNPAIDLYARSDFGRVLAQLLRDMPALLNRATVLVILGDARNNRRPARADLLREIARKCRAVIWLNPEPISRWNSGDSAIANYQPEVDALIECDNLCQLESALRLLR
ncbi:MAG TPA: VWA domain-containing protein [Candidatus Binataceae bacterium]|nr:VWA domain-containing protein [Candidatus Binataceae bacterium]